MSQHAIIVFIRVFAAQFYRIHASLFFLLIAFAGGFMRSQDHLALAEFFVASPVLALIPVATWLSYAFFVVNFNLEMMKNRENNFAKLLLLYPVSTQWLVSAIVVAIQLLPVLIYCTFLLGVASGMVLILPMIIHTSGLCLVFLLCAWSTRWLVIRQNDEFPFNLFPRVQLWSLSKPYVSIVLNAVMRRQALAIIGYKILSTLILLGALSLYETDQYDLRLMNLAVLVSFMTSISFVLEWHHFENQAFTIFRRMPFSHLKRIGYALLIVIIFSLPEIFILLRNKPGVVGVPDLFITLLLGISICFFWYAFLYVRDWRREQIISFSSLTGIGLFVAILAGVPGGIICAIHFVCGVLLYLKYYTRFEYRSAAT